MADHDRRQPQDDHDGREAAEGEDSWADILADGLLDEDEPLANIDDRPSMAVDAGLGDVHREVDPAPSGLTEVEWSTPEEELDVLDWLGDPAPGSVSLPESSADAPGWPTETTDEGPGDGESGDDSWDEVVVEGDVLSEPVVETPAEPRLAVVGMEEGDVEDLGEGLSVTATNDVGGPEIAPVAAATPAPKRRLGRILGPILGAVLAIPLVLATLVGLAWTGLQDADRLRGWMPQPLASLLPAPARGVAMRESTSVDRDGVTMDDGVVADSLAVTSPAVTSPAVTSPAVTSPAVTSPVVVEPGEADGFGELPVTAALESPPLESVANEPPSLDAYDPPMPDDEEGGMVPDTTVSELAAADPGRMGVDDLLGRDLFPEAAIERRSEASFDLTQLDLTQFDRAVTDAENAMARMENAAGLAGLSDPAGQRALVGWYRALARVAEQFALVERTASESGRPLTPSDEAAAPMARLSRAMLANPEAMAALPRLARDWIAFAGRDSEGVVLAATFDSTRSVGPYWRSTVRIEEPGGGRSRTLTLVSRAEPAVDVGGRVIVSGVLLTDGVVWAADVRSVDP